MTHQITIEGISYLDSFSGVSHEDLPRLNKQFAAQLPMGFGPVLELKAHGDTDDFDPNDKGGEQKVFVSVTFACDEKSAKNAGRWSFPAELIPVLDAMALDLNSELVVDREDWEVQEVCQMEREHLKERG